MIEPRYGEVGMGKGRENVLKWDFEKERSIRKRGSVAWRSVGKLGMPWLSLWAGVPRARALSCCPFKSWVAASFPALQLLAAVVVMLVVMRLEF